MRKIFKLYQNEMIKLIRKTSVIVLLIIMVASTVAVSGFFKIADSIVSTNIGMPKHYSNTNISPFDNEIKKAEESLKGLKYDLEQAAGDETLIMDIKTQIINTEQNIVLYQYLSDNNINSDTDYRGAVAGQLCDKKRNMLIYSLTPELYPNEIKALNEQISKLEAITTYSEYLTFKNNEIKNDTNLSSEEKEIYIESNTLRAKLIPDGNSEILGDAFGSSVESQITVIEKSKIGLLKDEYLDPGLGGIVNMSPQQREKTQNELAITEYKLEHYDEFKHSFSSVSAYVLPATVGAGLVVLAILIMILAGSSISGEISSGSIKSLIVTPTKRYKIITAKFLSLTTVLLLGTIIVCIFSTLFCGLLFGEKLIMPYVYAQGGIVHSINFFVYQILNTLVLGIDIFVFMVFAVMLSAITRNSALSITLPLSVFFVGSDIFSIITMLFKGRWVHFVPFSNLNLASRIFPADNVGSLITQANLNDLFSYQQPSLTFSLIYLAVFVSLMMYIAYDSFIRRDLK